MAAKPSREMLTTGVVGSALLASAWGLILLMLVIVMTQIGTKPSLARSLDVGFAAGLLGVLAGLLWMGGCICEGIGWVGLGRLHPGLPRTVGWLEGALPVLALLMLMIAMATFDVSELMPHLLALMQAVYAVLALIWLARRAPAGLRLAAVVGYTLALGAGVTAYVIALARIEVELAGLLLLIVGAGGALVAHLATGRVFARSRILVDSVNSF